MNPKVKKRVLLVDDEDALTTMCALLLESTGHFSVRSENLGAEALVAAQEFQPDLIFLDRHLPDRNGESVAAELRADPELSAVPVVFLTGALTREEAAELSEQNGKLTLAKPITHNELITRALEIVGGLDYFLKASA